MDPLTPLLIVLLPFIPVWLIWMALFLVKGPGEEILRTKRHQFLGPGGPDDPFADDPFDEAETVMPTPTPPASKTR